MESGDSKLAQVSSKGDLQGMEKVMSALSC